MSRGGEIGLSKEIRERVHDRVPPGVGTKHYDRFDYLPQLWAAMEAWEKRLQQIISGAKVVPINSRTTAS
jgi:hypothetical protein